MDVEFLIEKVVFGGEGISALDGKACFIEGVLPGEKVLAAITDDKKNFLRARLIKVLTPSPERVEPPCVYIKSCGGCQYQHASYSQELKIKEGQAREALSRFAGIHESRIQPIVASGSEYRYRNSVTLHAFTNPPPKNAAPLGFFGRDNVSKIPIKDCLLVDERFQSIFGEKFRIKSPKTKISFKLSEKGEIFSDSTDQFFRVAIGGRHLVASSEGFFQNNLGITALIAETVSNKMKSFGPVSTFFDLYAGVGTFSVLCAGEAKKIIAIEENGPSLDALRMNKEEHKMPQMDIVPGRVENTFPQVYLKNNSAGSVIFLDPPRQGLGGELAQVLAASKETGMIFYLSCDLMTLARDLKIILSGGQYRLLEATPFDMFPRTKHIEVLAVLART